MTIQGSAAPRKVPYWALFLVPLVLLVSRVFASDPPRLIVKFADEAITWTRGQEENCFPPNTLTFNDSLVEAIVMNRECDNICKADPSIGPGDSLYVGETGDTVYVPYLYYRFLMDFPTNALRDSAISDLNALQNVLYADAVVSGEPLSSETNDTWFFDSWHWRNIWDYDVDADEAWQFLRGQYPDSQWTSDVLLGVYDMGFLVDHPDIDISRVINATPNNDWWHGTCVMGLVGAARPNNGTGVAGMHWVDTIKMQFSLTGLANTPRMRAIAYPYPGAWGVPYEIENAAFVTMKNVVWAVSVGNTRYVYPPVTPAWNRGVFGVTSFNANGEDGGWPSCGACVDISAPGSRVWTTINGGCQRYDGYRQMSGTSFSSPIVAGAAGMMIDQGHLKSPSIDLTAEDVMNIMEMTAEDANLAGYDTISGWGNLNVWYALDAIHRNPIYHDTVTSVQIQPTDSLLATNVPVRFLSSVPCTWLGHVQGTRAVDIYRVTYDVPFSPVMMGCPMVWGNAIYTWGLDTIEVDTNSVNCVPNRMATYLEAGTLTQQYGRFYTFQYRFWVPGPGGGGDSVQCCAPGNIENLRVYFTCMDLQVPLPPQIQVSKDSTTRTVTITPNRVTGSHDVSYRIERSTNRIDWETIESSCSETVYHDAEVVTGVKSYWYRVCAQNGSAESLPSGERGTAVDDFQATPLLQPTTGNTRQICEDKARCQHIVYEDGGYIYYSMRTEPTPRLRFLPEVAVSGPSCSMPSVAVWDSATPPRAFVAWLSNQDGLQVREIQRFQIGNIADLTTREGVLSPPALAAANSPPTLFVGVSGGGENNNGLWYWTCDSDGDWGSSSSLPESESMNVISVASVANDEQPNIIHVVWADGASDAIYYCKGSYASNQWAWAGFVRVDDSTLTQFAQKNYPSVSVDRTGYPHVAWEAYNNSLGLYSVFTRKQVGSLEWGDFYEVSWDKCSETRHPVLGVKGYRGCTGLNTDTTVIAVEWNPNGGKNDYIRFFEFDDQNGGWVRSIYGRTEPIRSSSIVPFSWEYWDGGTWEEDRYESSFYYTGLAGATTPYEVLRSPYHEVTLPPLMGDLVITSDTTITTPFDLAYNIFVRDGATLTIQPATCGDNVVLCSADKEIQVESESGLQILGTESDQIVFRAADSTETWDGIYADSASLNMEWVEMYDTRPYCVFANKPQGGNTPVMIRNCHFDGGKIEEDGDVLRLWGSPGLTQNVENCIIDHVPVGHGLYLYNCYVDFDSVTIQGCNVVNSYIKNVSGIFDHCTLKDTTSDYAVLFNAAPTTPWFKCCSFQDLAPHAGNYTSTIYAVQGTSPMFGGEVYAQALSNVFNDSCEYMMRMYGSGALPVIDNTGGMGPGGYNDWIQRSSSGRYIYWGNAPANPKSPYKAEEQYWNYSPVDSTKFYPSSTRYFDYTPYELDPWGICGEPQGSGAGRGSPGTIAGLDSTGDLFSEALYQESIENFAEAQILFRLVAETDSLLCWDAAAHIITTERRLGTGGEWIPSLMDSVMAAQDYAYDARVYGNRLLANYHLDRTEYTEAINICVNLLESGLTFEDSMIVATELVGIQMAAGIIGDGGEDLDSDIGGRIPVKLRISSVEEGLELEQHLLELLGAGKELARDQVLLPTKYQLYQNYPNPFNPSTDIRFDLPAAGRVELRIYNILGQEVVTLADRDFPAGAYRILWHGTANSGRSVASGVYIYRIKAGSFIDTKKMVLLR